MSSFHQRPFVRDARRRSIRVAALICGGFLAGASIGCSHDESRVPTGPTAPIQLVVPMPMPEQRVRISGRVIDDENATVSNAHLTVWGLGGSLLIESDASGSFDVTTPVWQYGVGIWVEKPGFERAAHLAKVQPSDDEVRRDLRLHRVLRVAAGTSLRMSINPDDSLCGFDLEYLCRVVRITAASRGRIIVDAEPQRAAARFGLALADDLVFPSLSSAHLEQGVQPGAEVGVIVLLDGAAQASESVTFSTRFEPSE